MKDRAKRIAKYYNQCKLPKWATVLGVVLLAFGIVAAGVTAIFHDKYSSIFDAWESALTNVWFIAFIALVGVGGLDLARISSLDIDWRLDMDYIRKAGAVSSGVEELKRS